MAWVSSAPIAMEDGRSCDVVNLSRWVTTMIWSTSPRLFANIVGVSSIALFAITCAKGQLLAPTGATIDVAISPTTIAAGGDTAAVAILVREADGLHVDNDTEVDIAVTNAMVCATPGSAAALCTNWVALTTLKTVDGVARTYVLSGTASGTATLTVRSGPSTGTGTVTLSSRVVGAGGKILVQSDKDTVSVGDKVRILVFATNQDGTQTAENTRLVLTAAGNAVSKQILLTHDGFAETMFIAVKTGAATVSAVSGAITGHATVEVK
jgi:hypothetical protein